MWNRAPGVWGVLPAHSRSKPPQHGNWFTLFFGTFLWHTSYVSMKVKRTKRTHILLPEDLAREIDALAGRRGRSAFLVETAREAVRRRKLLRFLEGESASWKEQDHPELAKGPASWVRKLRRQSESRKPKRP